MVSTLVFLPTLGIVNFVYTRIASQVRDAHYWARCPRLKDDGKKVLSEALMLLPYPLLNKW